MNVQTDTSRHKPPSLRLLSRPLALPEWQRQLTAGERTPTTFDDLWRAAGAEQLALEHEAVGVPELAAGYWADARRLWPAHPSRRPGPPGAAPSVTAAEAVRPRAAGVIDARTVRPRAGRTSS